MKRLVSAFALVSSMVIPATATETVDAVWTRQKVEFTYYSLVTAYSCDLMEARLRMLLRHVGAADDAEVTMPPCAGFNVPQKRHRVTLEFSTLVPAEEGATDVVPATWTEVELSRRQPRSIADQDCELIEDFQSYVLPVIVHQVIGGEARCNASNSAILGRLELRVLKPVPQEPPVETAEEPAAEEPAKEPDE